MNALSRMIANLGTKLPEQIQALKDGQELLPPGDRKFAMDLYNRFVQAKTLSDKQWHWVAKLNEAMIPKAVLTQHLGDVSGILGLFKQALGHLKYPKVTFKLPTGGNVQLAIAGPTSSQPGSIVVTDGKGDYFGRIQQNGGWQPHRSLAPAQDTALSGLLVQFSANPAQLAATHGHTHGYCCFCGTAITSPGSLEVGYGPVCAKRWGLPWRAK